MRHVAILRALRVIRLCKGARMTEMRDDHTQDALQATDDLPLGNDTNARTIARRGPVLSRVGPAWPAVPQDRAAVPGRARRHRATGQVGNIRLGSRARAEAHVRT